MSRVDCFEKHGLKELASKYSGLVEKGMPEGEAARSTVLDYHKKLHDELNGLKKSIGVKESEYAAPDNIDKIKKINDNYDQKVNAVTKPKIRVSAEEMKQGQPKKEKGVGVMKKAQNIEDLTNPEDVVMQHFANGGKINSSAMDELFNGKNEERRSRIGLLSKEGQSVDQLAHQLWESDKTGNNTTEDYKDAIEKVLQEHNSPASMAKSLVERYVDNNVRADMSASERREVNADLIRKIDKEVEGLDDDTKKELTNLLSKYQDKYGFIDWDKLEEDSNGFSPDILNLSDNTQNKLNEIIERQSKSEPVESGNTRSENGSSQKEEGEEKELKPEVKKLANELANLLGNVGLDKNAQNKAITLKDLGIEKDDNIKTVLDKLIKHGGEFTEIFKFLRGLPDIGSLKFDIKKLRYREGEYVPKTNLAESEEQRKQVRIDPGAENAYYALAHEMQHFLTLDSETVEKYGDKKKISTLQDIYNFLKQKNEGTKQYGFLNFNEFLAELAINSDLRKEVGDITTTEKEFNNALGKSKSVLEYIHDFFKDLFAKLFGASKHAQDIDFNKPLIENASKLFTDVFFSGQKIIPEESTAWKFLGIQQMDGRTQFGNAALENPGLDNAQKKIISDFVDAKLDEGVDKADIKEALAAHGLTQGEIDSFFPTPKPKIKVVVGNPNSTGDIIGDYELMQSGKVNDFLSGKTLENIFGESPDGNQSYAVQNLSDMLQDGKNMIGIAQAQWGGDIASYGKPLFQYIQGMSNDNALTNKKAVLLATFLGEIKEEAFRDPQMRGWLSPLENAVESYYQQFMNQKGKELAAGRLLRLFRDKYLGDVFADRILEQQQIKQKQAIKDALGRNVDDKVAATSETVTNESKTADDNAANKKTKQDAADQAKKKSISQEDAKQKADNKLKDIEDRLGKHPKETLIDKITAAIKKINCK